MRALALSVILCLLSGLALAAIHFPQLTGRVVDDAHILSLATRQALTQQLAEYENGTGNQVVVVTLPSLQGYSIEEYGYQLGRHWQIGQKGKNNGALLIVAPKDRQVRIEVGYGLEPLLTDAAASTIVQSVILPQFRAGHIEQGVIAGTQAMLDVLGGKSRAVLQSVSQDDDSWLGLLAIPFLIWIIWLSRRHPLMAWWILGSAMRFGGSESRRSGWGGFSGGGGSFGGGGASGQW